jgi:hypothetical protein
MTEELPWRGLTEAAEMTGQNRETLRSRARRGLIPSRRGNAGQLLVQIPDGMTRAATATDQGMTEALTELREEIADLRDRATRAESERDQATKVAEAQIAAAERIIARLEADLAEARRPWWRRVLG